MPRAAGSVARRALSDRRGADHRRASAAGTLRDPYRRSGLAWRKLGRTGVAGGVDDRRPRAVRRMGRAQRNPSATGGAGGKMGFAALYPSYGWGTWFVSFEAPGYPPPSSHSTKTPNTTTSITVSQPRLPRSPATTVGTRGGYSDRTFSTGWSAVGSAPRRHVRPHRARVGEECVSTCRSRWWQDH